MEEEKFRRLERAFNEAVSAYADAAAKIVDPNTVKYLAAVRETAKAREAMNRTRMALDRVPGFHDREVEEDCVCLTASNRGPAVDTGAVTGRALPLQVQCTLQ